MFSESSLHQEILDSLQDGVYFVDRDRIIVFWNKGAETISGYSRLQVLGRPCHENLLQHIDASGNLLCLSECPLSRCMENGQPREDRVYLLRADGTRVPVWVRVAPLVTAEGEITGAVEIFSDRSSLANSFDRVNSLERMSAVDRQMGIANRRYSEAHLRARIQEGFSFGISLGLLFIKIDHFHRISETYGREIGTRVLRTVAETLIYNLRPFDFIGRWDNEAVVVMLSNVHEDGLLERADNLRMLVERSVLMVGKPIRVTVSIGATLIQPGDNLETWVERANALSEAHGGGGHNKVILG